MSVFVDAASWFLLCSGALLCVTGAIGLLRLPDFYSRTHGASVADPLGAFLILLGLMLQAGPTLVAVKLLTIAVFLMLSGPATAHALAKAAFGRGLRFGESDETTEDT